MEKKKEQLELANVLLKVAEDIRTLADSIQAAYSGPADASTEKASEVKPKQEITLEKVRGILAEKSRSGHTAEVRAILRKFGADRLSDIDPKDYAAVLKDAEVL